MPKVHRKTDVTTGHTCWPPTIPASFSPDTFAMGHLNVVRYGDTTVPHACPGNPPHPGTYIGQKCEVYVNKRYIQLHGDPIDCGDFVDTHDPVWDCCSEVMEMLKPKIEVNPMMINFGSRLVGGSTGGPANIGGIIGELDMPFIPVVVLNVGGPVLIVQYAIYGPINPTQSHVCCNPVDGCSVDEYPDFIFKGVCWPLGLAGGESSIFYVNFEPQSAGDKLVFMDIYSQPEQEIKKVILKGKGIELPSPP